MTCGHGTFHLNRVEGRSCGGMWFSAECDLCGAVTEWCLTPEEASTRMRVGGRWVAGEEDGNEREG